MLEESAVIIALAQDANGQPQAMLEIARKTACGLCGKTRGCGNSIWGKLFNHQAGQFKAQNPINAQVGDEVVVGINETAVMKSALLLYILPLVTMFLAAMLSTWMNNLEWVTMLAAVAGLVLGLVWVKGHTTASPYFKQHQPTILRLQSADIQEKVIQVQPLIQSVKGE